MGNLAPENLPDDSGKIAAALDTLNLQCSLSGSESTIAIGGADPSPHLRDGDVNAAVSAVSGVPEVRRLLVEKQREYAAKFNVVMEGRDIGSAVFPETPYKFYIDASPDIRARRRATRGKATRSCPGTNMTPRAAPRRSSSPRTPTSSTART